jgi:ubiquinone biosynthesis protein UbiJ
MLLNLSLLSLEKLVNGYIRLDEESLAQLNHYAGKTLAIAFNGLDFTLYILICNRGIQFCQTSSHSPNATLHGTPITLARMLVSKDAPSLIRAGEVNITGDVEFVQQFYGLMTKLQVDWEEQLAFFSGDLLASSLGAMTSKAHVWQQDLSKTLKQNLVEYLQEELRHLPPAEEVRDFFYEVSAARLSCDRLHARLERLELCMKEKA